MNRQYMYSSLKILYIMAMWLVFTCVYVDNIETMLIYQIEKVSTFCRQAELQFHQFIFPLVSGLGLPSHL